MAAGDGTDGSNGKPANVLGKLANGLASALNTLASKVPQGPFATLAYIITAVGVIGIILGGTAGDVRVVFAFLAFALIFGLGSFAIAVTAERRRGAEQQLVELGRVPVPEVMTVAKNLTPDEEDDLRRALRQARLQGASILDLSEDEVRSNLFLLDDDGMLRIAPGFYDNMTRTQEQTIALHPGEGSTGLAYEQRQQNIAVLETDWGKAAIPGSELRKADPRLRWIVSTPLLTADKQQCLGVLNVDGLDERPVEGLERLLEPTRGWATLIGLALAAAQQRLTGGTK